MDEMDADPSLSRTPAVGTYLHRMTADDGVALARSELVPDRKWERSWDYHNLHLAIGIDHTIWCFRSIPGTADEVNGVIMCRPVGRRDYSPRQKAIVREVHAETGPLVGGPLARFTDPAPSELPPRVRQVLRCLLEGDADKQVAARLGLTRHTVNEYVKVIHAHFGVCSRGKLLARWVRLFMPMLRGENGNPGTYESFLGEVDDAIAAGRFVTSLPNVDGANVFVAGHSVGVVLTCLVSMLPSPCKAAAALDGYVDMESWAGGRQTPTSPTTAPRPRRSGSATRWRSRAASVARSDCTLARMGGKSTPHWRPRRGRWARIASWSWFGATTKRWSRQRCSSRSRGSGSSPTGEARRTIRCRCNVGCQAPSA
jgi:DNA-binding CsgD family transcriptional regulator